MIGFIRGKILSAFKTGKSTSTLVVWPFENATQPGVGYSIVVSEQIALDFSRDEPIELWLYTVQTDKESYAIGLESIDAMKQFLDLISVSGVGPKTALNILGSLRVEGVKNAIVARDLKALSKVPGLGQKTAAKIMIELGGKDGYNTAIAATKGSSSGKSSKYSAVIATLQKLGYSLQQAKDAVERAEAKLELIDVDNVAEMVKIVLGYLA